MSRIMNILHDDGGLAQGLHLEVGLDCVEW